MKKIVLIIIDGLGDRPISALKNKTPLEAAKTPNLDWLAENGVCGLAKLKFRGATPTSEEGHFSLFGYNPETYKIKRGIITATGTGMKAKKGDVAIRGNFATVDKDLNMIDRRAGRIKNPGLLIKALNGIKINNVRFLLKSATEHRLGIIMRGKNLSPNISDGDPFYGKLGKKARKIKPLDKSSEASFTAKTLNKFLEKARLILKSHLLNKKREKLGLLPADYILTRGASFLPELPSFKKKYNLKACCIAGKFLYKQIGKILGMDLIKVKGANGLVNTNLEGKVQAVKKALRKYNFVFLHIKATDSLAEDGNFRGKKEFIEKIDKNMSSLLKLKNTLIVVTADHSTSCLVKRHCSEPVPILISGSKRNLVKEFSERACKKGELGIIKQINLMKTILKLAKE